MRPRRRIEMKPVMSGNSVEYIVGEDDNDLDTENFCEKPRVSGWGHKNKKPSKPAGLCPDDPELDGGSSSTDDSSDSSHTPQSKPTPAFYPTYKNSVCATCGRGPFRSLKLHLLHCSGVRVKYQCFLCKELFMTETQLNQHYMSLYSCHICGQVFSHESLYYQHPCPKKSKSPLVLFCSESMPQVCNICKSFFASEKTLQSHINSVHTSVVSTKVCIITDPSALTDKKVSPAAPSASSPLEASNQVNGKFSDTQTCASSSSFLSTSSAPQGRPAWAICTQPPKSDKGMGLVHPPAALSPDTTPAATASVPDSPQMPTILAMFENDSQDVALMKRMNTGWRSKTPYPCRQCGAVFRQPSLVISHRYHHRGRRLHQCQCGRAFKHRLHLLRHCVQHAENTSYICVSCGETFTGATVLAEHIKGKSRKKWHSELSQRCKVRKKCRAPFTCDCGQHFLRPSAYIWHQLQNRKKTKCLKKCLK